jgi:plastocyanin
MIHRFQLTTLLIIAGSTTLAAADIHGTIVVKRQLTRKSVTAPAGAYQRGVGVPLDVAPEEDVLAFERQHVAVFLEGKGPAAPQTVEITQKNRLFNPDLITVAAGSSVSFPNLDVIFHNVFSLSKVKTFDLGNYPKGQTRTVTLGKPGVVLVNCRLHPNMSAAIVVTPNSWSAMPDATGNFVIANVAPGSYTIATWHKSAGYVTKTVDVTAEGASVEILVPLDDKSAPSPMTRR